MKRNRVLHLFNRNTVSGPEALVIPNLALAKDYQHFVVNLFEKRIEQDPLKCFDSYSLAKEHHLWAERIPVASRFDQSAIDQLARFIEKNEVNIIHAHDIKPTYYAIKARSRVNYEPLVISTNHGVRARYGLINKLYYFFYEKVLLKKCDRVLAVCSSDFEILQYRVARSLKSKVVLHLNGINCPSFLMESKEDIVSSWQKRLGFDLSNKVLVGVVGRISKEKNHTRIIDIWSRIFRDVNAGDAVLLIVGDGDQEAEMKELVKAYGLEESIFFLGYESQISKKLKALDIVLSFSLAEGLPINLLEAGWAQVPFLSHAIDGVAELSDGIQPPYILDKDISNSDAAKHLSELILDQRLRREIGERIHSFVHSNFSGERWIKDLELIYSKALNIE